MAARAQTVYYPWQAKAANFDPNAHPMCIECNASTAAYTFEGCCLDSAVKNTTGAQTDKMCSSFCNVQSNNVCATRQSYCAIGHETIYSHSDVHAHPAIACVASGQIIAKSWTAAYWNALFNELDTAEQLGHQYHNPINPSTTVGSNQKITADIFNMMVKKYKGFRTSPAAAGQGQVITAALAAQFKNLYQSLKFVILVCDICNTAKQGRGVCDCNCSCPCSCDCGCDCPCSCDCGCDCPCSCQCSCNNPCTCSNPGCIEVY